MSSLNPRSDYYGGGKSSRHQAAINAQEELSAQLEELENSISTELASLRSLSFREIKELDEKGSLQRMNDFFEVAQELFLPCLFTLVAMSRKTGATADDKQKLFAYFKDFGELVIDVMALKEIK